MDETIGSHRLRQAVTVVRKATQEFVRDGYFPRGVLTWLDRWIKGLSDEKAALALESLQWHRGKAPAPT